jgi:hypothetical protein
MLPAIEHVEADVNHFGLRVFSRERARQVLGLDQRNVRRGRQSERGEKS